MTPGSSKRHRENSTSRPALTGAKSFVKPLSRRWMLITGSIGGIILMVYTILDMAGEQQFVSSGPLSASHASLEKDCASCHRRFASLAELQCSGCHEVSRLPGRIFDFSAHYIYRSGRLDRRKIAKEEFANREAPCYACHPEHRGRQASLVTHSDALCRRCHNFGNFEDGHPEFWFRQVDVADPANLNFTHKFHVDYIKSIEGLGPEEITQSCGTCHSALQEGAHFGEIAFEAHCSACHLNKRGDPPHKDVNALRRGDTRCQLCHKIASSSVLPVQKVQRVMFRAEFDHRPHLVNMDCFDCHIRIRMTKTMRAEPSSDKAETLNIPGVKNCQQCHKQDLASNRCVDCHVFHPNSQLMFSVN